MNGIRGLKDYGMFSRTKRREEVKTFLSNLANQQLMSFTENPAE